MYYIDPEIRTLLKFNRILPGDPGSPLGVTLSINGCCYLDRLGVNAAVSDYQNYFNRSFIK